jgi:pimeloyl-ACP methyl ester carboxylesterase
MKILYRLCVVSILVGEVFVFCARAYPTESGASGYVRQSGNESVIVLVHGVLGDPRSTWTNEQTKAYWPEMMAKDPHFNRFDIYVVGYPSSFLVRDYSVNELVEVLRRDLDSANIFSRYKRIYFLCHSMGGLVVRAFLVRYRDKVPQVPFIYFFSAPTDGAQISRIAALVSSNPQFNSLKPTGANEYLSSIQNDWLAGPFDSKIASYCAYETHETRGVLIVGRDSAIQLCNKRVDPINSDHIGIVKPADTNAESYKAFLTALNENLKDNAQQQQKEQHPIEVSYTVSSLTNPITILPGQKLYFIPLNKARSLNKRYINLMEVSNLEGNAPLLWPDSKILTENKHGFFVAWRCDITNHGRDNLLEVEIPLVSAYPIDSSHSLWETSLIPVNPLDSGKTRTLYLVNDCSIQVSVKLPQFGSARTVGEETRRRFRLVLEDWHAKEQWFGLDSSQFLETSEVPCEP